MSFLFIDFIFPPETEIYSKRNRERFYINQLLFYWIVLKCYGLIFLLFQIRNHLFSNNFFHHTLQTCSTSLDL